MDPEKEIRRLAKHYAETLNHKVKERIEEMKRDDTSHYLLYGALGIKHKEGELIDIYQNKGRFLYRYAGTLLEKAAIICIQSKFPNAQTTRIENTISPRPKKFEIDSLVNNRDAIEIKWRDATTDGDHIVKEHARMRCISNTGYKPIRVMFYYPNRAQAQKIQKKLEGLYIAEGGEYHYGEGAWQWIKNYTEVDLLGILQRMDEEVEADV